MKAARNQARFNAPKVMVRLLLFGYCEGVRSSRQIERRCVRDVAYRVLAGKSVSRPCQDRSIP
jgi:transposase